MTFEQINARLQKIRDSSGDDETAHGLEDALYAEFIAYVSQDPNDDDLGEKAKLVLSTDEMEFARWCA